ncbi:succinate dehydrogenase, hydrophobic membrane anchor protein [Plasticicumulans sp.]|uniref:succinate dehydrogenase, hydrophobic membrane anchor protein n=1 Tax=Plasticicumulans sp. TaxID=2307179 RepID=UPI002B6662C4|nr:succinate dehydrogenase, hydrophobic membrane anchor protein [Plasticicumulans sp.]MBS0601215.1 succinate dehydrogenase, hydrophobic membrane anchor protein [Pseudomonadota bacterium]HMV38593.1 succinate dehydrogenase, hydrophobic membrane anchor protein [Plasticicumulans sp.]HMW28038.1 succinate dehydrogenase, hydrophobic membrane anchor protein [Plasticicumulans sp.]HMW40951.1 succinate dehydrogenase, hydrophobic membrane anchor protein [Plasticicumulans sp.]HMX52997.1 succinate dehydroge
MSKSSLRTPLAHVRGLGSSRSGVHHWWLQRLSAVILVPLVLWFAVSLLSVAHADHATMKAWVSRPFNTALLVVLLTAMFYHARLGLQVVIEDYVHEELVKLGALLAMNLVVIVAGATAVISVLKIAFGG